MSWLIRLAARYCLWQARRYREDMYAWKPTWSEDYWGWNAAVCNAKRKLWYARFDRLNAKLDPPLPGDITP